VSPGGTASESPPTELAAQYPQARWLVPERSFGYGASLRTGIAGSQHPLVLTVPADGTFRGVNLKLFLDEIDRADVVAGVRRGRSWLRRQREDFWPWCFFGLRTTDPRCGLRLYRKSLFERFPIQSVSTFADVEILAKASFVGCLLSEVEVDGQPPTSPGPETAERSPTSDFWRVLSYPVFDPVKPVPAPG
jgi:glycosyltransferase involved in cell wall biosynthesis